jgi:hypothetical protein
VTPSARIDDDPSDIAAMGRRALARLRRAARERDHQMPPAPFDPAKAEAEFYDAIYGARTGTVENIGPVDVSSTRRTRAHTAR